MKTDETYFNEYKNPIYNPNCEQPKAKYAQTFRPRAEYAWTLKPKVFIIHELLLDQGQILHELLDSLGMLGVAKKKPLQNNTC